MPPAPSFRLELVLADLLGLDRRLLGLALRAGQQNREHEDGGRAQRQQREQPQNVHRRIVSGRNASA